MRTLFSLAFVAFLTSIVFGEEEGFSPRDSAVQKLASKEVNIRLEGAREAATVQEKEVTAALIKALTDKHQAVRELVAESLALRTGKTDRKKAAIAMGKRIPALTKKKESKPECLKLVEAMHDLADPAGLKPLLANIKTTSDQEISEARLQAAANIPSKKVIDELLKFLKAGKRANWRHGASQRALRYATQENVKGGVDGWLAWWRENEKTFNPIVAADKRLAKANDRKEKQARKDKNRERRKRKKKDDTK